VIEAETGRPFHDLLREEILAPAEMTHTGPDDPATERSAGTEFFEPAILGRIRTSRPVDNSCKFGAGGLLGSAADLVRFGNALLRERLVPGARLTEMMRPQVLASGRSTAYGLGFGLVEVDGVRLAAHSGGAIGGRSYLLIDRANGIVVAIASNVEGEKPSKEALGVWRAFRAEAGNRAR
jgi:CubicO group peptidase (beta-lactamase class C family)